MYVEVFYVNRKVRKTILLSKYLSEPNGVTWEDRISTSMQGVYELSEETLLYCLQVDVTK